MFVVVTNRQLAIHHTPIDTGSQYWLASGVFTLEQAAMAVPRRLQHGGTDSVLTRLDLLFDWRDVIAIAAVDPWPCLRVSWRHQGMRVEERLKPPRGRHMGWDQAVCELIDHVDAAGIRVELERGWADHDLVPWEKAAWPEEIQGEGGYRGTARSRVVAHREPGGVVETLRAWWAKTGEWTGTPREVVVTDEDLFARRNDGPARLPVSALRTKRSSRGDSIYVFGRRTHLVLPRRDECSVCEHLDGLMR